MGYGGTRNPRHNRKSACRSLPPKAARAIFLPDSSDHPEYCEDRIALELEVKFAVRHASSTVRRYMVKRCPPSDSQAWRSFLKNQAKAIWT